MMLECSYDLRLRVDGDLFFFNVSIWQIKNYKHCIRLLNLV